MAIFLALADEMKLRRQDNATINYQYIIYYYICERITPIHICTTVLKFEEEVVAVAAVEVVGGSKPLQLPQ
jgi:hypothetical protein